MFSSGRTKMLDRFKSDAACQIAQHRLYRKPAKFDLTKELIF